MLKLLNAVSKFFDFMRTEQDKRLNDLVDNGWKSARIVGNGTLKIDASEVRNSGEFKGALDLAKLIVEAENERQKQIHKTK